jgi:hypothetical protein
MFTESRTVVLKKAGGRILSDKSLAASTAAKLSCRAMIGWWRRSAVWKGALAAAVGTVSIMRQMDMTILPTP